jgi:16S rRNA processing protein RimM
LTLVQAGVVGRAHGLDGSFYVEQLTEELPDVIRVGDRELRIERRAGRPDRPILRLEGVPDPSVIKGEAILVESELDAGEWLVSDLVGCEVPGIGYVERVVGGPSCDVLEVGEEGILIPLIGDAVKRVDIEARVIEVDREFLGL